MLFTEPKTGTHLLKPILAELTGRAPYCPREYMKKRALGHKDHQNGKFLELGCNCPNKAVEAIWETNERQGSFLHFNTP